ncbi:MAG: hypothetical protein ACO2ZM_08175, partial [Francisellaceae bacterium]
MMKPVNNRWRFLSWVILIGIFGTGFIIMLFRGIPLNTNMLALLPSSTGQNKVMSQASSHFFDTMSDEVIILLGARDLNTAITAADDYAAALKTSGQFSRVISKIDGSEQEAWGRFYFPYRLNLLTPKDRALLEARKYNSVVGDARATLYSPMGLSSSSLIEKNPFYLFQHYMMSLSDLKTNLTLQRNHVIAKYDGLYYAMIYAHLSNSSFGISNQNKVLITLNHIDTKIHSKNAQIAILKTWCLGPHNRFCISIYKI